MGHYSLLALVALVIGSSVSAEILCNSGSATTDQQGQILTSYIKAKSCQGVCNTISAPLTAGETLHIFGCEEKYKSRKTILSGDLCGEDLCNTLPGLGLPLPEEIIDPLSNFTFTCYVGLKHGTFSTGGVQPCDGACGTLQTWANGLDSEAFFCAPRGLCAAFIKNVDDPYEACTTVDGNVTGCCCESKPNCNALNFHVTDLPPLPTDNRVPIACYAGIHFGGALISGGEYVACQGNCASLKWQFVVGLDLTLYSCDQATICRGYGLNNKCASVDNGTYYGCCCDSDGCIDPTRVPPVSPDNPVSDWMECYIGMHIKNASASTNAPFDAGSQNYCNGMCASALTMLNGYEVEAFYCAQRSFCQAMDTVNRCDTSSIGDQILSTCCCDDSANCNTKNRDIPAVTPDPTVMTPQIIACYQGLVINNQTMSGGFVACNGDCASITLPTTIGGELHEVSLLTCDPANLCRQLGLINNCDKIDGVISGCCCDTDVCINPYIPKYPNGNNSLNCYVGVTVGTNYTVGGSMPCAGECASFESTVNGVHAAGYFCAPRSLCSSLGVHNDCASILGSLYAKGCCCDWDNNCNAIMDNVIVPDYVPSNRPPLACYSGLSVNGQLLQDGNQYMTCRGDCGSITFTTKLGGTDYAATMFSCDPVNICGSFNLKDSCGVVRQGDAGGVSGCCCSWNDCIDINNPRVKPSRDNLQCFVGFTVEGQNSTTVGSPMLCDGNCASIETVFNGVNGWGFFCASTKLCSGLNMTNDCATIFNDQGSYIMGCCCDNDNNCNINHAHVGPPVPPVTGAPDNRVPIVCYSGLSINNHLLTPTNSYTTCQGMCASATFSTTLHGTMINTTISSCDPVSLCSSLSMGNSCNSIQNGGTTTSIYGCCCDWDNCIDMSNNGMISSTNNTHKPENLQCLVGYSVSSLFVGGSMPCTGSCASVQTSSNGSDLFGYFCAPDALCDGLGVRNKCGTVPTTQNLTGCCCDQSSNCNNMKNITIPPYNPPNRAPIACYYGMALNGKLLSDPNSYSSCRGDCGSITFSTTAGSTPINATIYACDPVTVCQSFNISNGCGSSPGGLVSGCCCEWNDCLDINTNHVKPSRDNLQCFVGFTVEGQNSTTVGSPMLCDGNCASIETVFNGVNGWGFFCASTKLCSGLNMTNDCATIFNDQGSYIKGCCCDNDNNCNINNANVGPPVPPATGAPDNRVPIVCYSGLSINNNLLTPSNSYTTCQGMCASATFSTTLHGTMINTTISSCDPVSLCSSLNMGNSCNSIQNGGTTTSIYGCCCDWDNCIDMSNNGMISSNNNTHKPDNLQCLVGYSVASLFVGASMPCTGSCASVQTSSNGVDLFGYFCAPDALCDGLGIHDQCATVSTAQSVIGCCCDQSSNCNNKNNVTIPPYNPPNRAPIACYYGMSVNGKLLSDPNSYSSCRGECGSITFSTTAGNTSINATIYACDPVTVCQSFNISNGCGSSPGGLVSGCCCEWNDCIDINTNQVKPSRDNLQCFVGLSTQAANGSSTYGGSGQCAGQCGSIMTSFNNQNVWGFFCASNKLCDGLDINNNCTTILTDGGESVNGCCCVDSNNCNLVNSNVVPPPTPPPSPYSNGPIACYSGLSISGWQVTANDSYMSCFGQCMSLTYTTQLSNHSIATTIYACDPVNLCSHYGISGNCGMVPSMTTSSSINGCCCSWDDCLDTSTGLIKPQAAQASQCFVGLSVVGAGTYGEPGKCDGQCGSLQTSINGHSTWGFFCASNSLCNGLKLNNRCTQIYNDANQNITGCCCNDVDNCNYNNAHVPPPPTNIPTQPPGTSPIACYAGLSLGVNDNQPKLLTANDSYQTCFGSCSAVAYDTVFSNNSVTATIFSCDPVAICAYFGQTGNGCGTINADNMTMITGCCCGWDDCIDTSTGQIKTTPAPPQPTKSSSFPSLLVVLILSFYKLFV